MRKKIIIFKALATCHAFLLLSSCGGSLGGGVEEFKTVMVSATAKTSRLESDVLTGNTCGATGSTGGTYATDNVDVDIKSTLYPKLTGQALSVRIDRVTISYTPANTSSPALPDQFLTLSDTVTPGGTLTLPVPVAKDILKLSLVNDKNLQLCSTAYYEYYVTITFDALEIGSSTSKRISTSLNVAFADRSGA
jgi:ribosomal protein L31